MPVISGVTAAVKLAEALYDYGLKTSRVGACAWPDKKEVVGGVVAFAKSA